MNRRNLLKIGVLFTTNAYIAKFALASGNPTKLKNSLQVWFDHGVYSTALPDGSWNLWVRADPRDMNVRSIRLRLQVAEDREFNSIIVQQVHIARKETSYILRTNFGTKVERPELYFRFVAMDSGLLDNPNQLLVSPIGELIAFQAN